MNKQEIKKFADAFAARRHELPRTFLALGNTVAAALRLWENRRPQDVPGTVELAADPERMTYTAEREHFPMLAFKACLCGLELRLVGFDEHPSLSLLETEAALIREMGFELYPER